MAAACYSTPVTNSTIWPCWNQDWHLSTTSTTSANLIFTPADVTWAAWQTGATQTVSTTTTSMLAWQARNGTYQETAGQRQAREAAAAQAARRAGAARRERIIARERALELLSFCLSPEQVASYRERGWFEVRSSKGRRYRIRASGQAGNVDLMPETGNERQATYCAHPPGTLPDPDAHIAQVLALVTDEDAFLRVANCHYLRAAA